MKRLIAICAAVICAAIGMSNHAAAQNVLERGTNIANLGVGFHFNQVSGTDYSSATLNLVGERCLADNLWDDKSAFTLGGQVVGNFHKSGISYFVGPRAGLHYQFVPKLDTYLFLSLGLYGYNYRDPDLSGVGFGWNSGLGVRYMFTPRIGGFAELGYGVTVLNVGATFKF